MAAEEKAAGATTLAGWKKQGIHTITLTSGAVVDIKLPDLTEMIRAKEIPNELLDTVLKVVQGTQKVTAELVEKQGEFVELIVPLTVVNPKITTADVKDIPAEDKELIVELATRQRDLDALGHHIGGLHKVKDFRDFRGLPTGFEDLQDV